MIVPLKKYIHSLVVKNKIASKYLALWNFRNYLENIGWFDSYIKQLPVNRHSKPIPWYTYSAIYFLEKNIASHLCIFEYGSGNSTLWWADRVSSVLSVEHNMPWFDYMKVRIPTNIDYRYCELIDGGEYCKTISKFNKQFDIIIIDGRDRNNCAKYAIKAIKDDGVIVWDNSDRSAYIEGFQFLSKNGFKRIDFHGNGPINNHDWSTSIFYRHANCLHI